MEKSKHNTKDSHQITKKESKGIKEKKNYKKTKQGVPIVAQWK